jgi:hypothetical protein
MLDNPGMSPTIDCEPVTRSEFRTAMERIDQRFIEIDQRFVGIDRRFDGVDQRFLGLEQRIDDLKLHFGVLHEALIQKVELILEFVTPLPARLDRHESRLTAVETEIDVIKAHLRARR